MLIAKCYIFISSLHHSVKVEMMMPLSHGTDYLFKPGNPGKRLFATHGIVSFIAVFNLTWVIFFMALFVSVISNV